MIHHVALPGELIMGPVDDDDSRRLRCIPWAGGFLTVQRQDDGTWAIVRLEHTNPFFYLHPVIVSPWGYKPSGHP